MTGLPILFVAFASATDGARDRTGIEWSLPFPAAMKRAKEERRLLLIKPIAFGTSTDGGW